MTYGDAGVCSAVAAVLMDEGSRRTSEARLAAEALLSHSGRSSSLTPINYGFVM